MVAIGAAPGAVPRLIALLGEGNEEAKTCAAYALANLAVNDDLEAAIGRAGGIPPLVKLARDGTAKQKENAVSALKNLNYNAENKKAIASAGGIPQ